jgi:pSer/pThr/pTyr-binding forkhead associated (FHA) protein
LGHGDTSPTETLVVDNEKIPESGALEGKASIAVDTLPQSSQPVSIKILKTGQTLLLEDGVEFILGRVGGTQPILPDIDLTPYGGYEEGVSRLHAIIKITPDQISITDLGSANGTWVNGKKTTAHYPYPLINGDILTLGKFQFISLIG